MKLRKTKYKKPITYLDYVGEPNSIKIEAYCSPRGQQVEFTIYINKKIALRSYYDVPQPRNREAIDDKVIQLCNSLISFNEKELAIYVKEEYISPAISVHRTIKKIRTKSGKLLWARPNKL